MDLNDTRKILNRIQEDSELLKKIVEAEVSVGRMLIEDEVYHDFKDRMLIAGNYLATAESLWSQEFARMSPRSKKFAVINNQPHATSR